jgi:hypothetical protein
MTVNGHSTHQENNEEIQPKQLEQLTLNAQEKPKNENSAEEEKPTTTTTNHQGIVPHDGQLLDAVLPIRAKTPSLGVPKILAKIKETNPDWQLSEKRLRKFLNSNLFPHSNERNNSNGINNSNSNNRISDPSSAQQLRSPSEPMWIPNYAWEKDWEAASADHSPNEPISSLDDTLLLECRQRSVKIEPVRFPASNKGSGLIAKDHLAKGTQVMKEDAFVWVPPTKCAIHPHQL